VLCILALVAGACGSESATLDNAQKPPSPHLGRLVVECEYSHTLDDDPIVAPGEPGASHSHDFFGNTAVDADTSDASLYDLDDTSCAMKSDGASYWAPTVLLAGVPQTPLSVDAYYRAGRTVDPATVEVYPEGLKVIAGDSSATEPQPFDVIGWSCGQNNRRHHLPPDCGAGAGLTLRISFPDCWDGVRLDAPDHASHMAYSQTDGCPDTHPHALLELEMVILYDISGPVEGLELSSGSPLTAHADFYNGWDTGVLQREIENCIHGDIVCGIAGIGS